MADRLKSCPFCGGEAEMIAIPTGLNKYSYMPSCKDSSCCGRSKKQWVDLDTAVYAWNRRPKVVDKTDFEPFEAKLEVYNNCTVQVLIDKAMKIKDIVWWRNDDV